MTQDELTIAGAATLMPAEGAGPHRSVNDFLRYGAGFVRAIALLRAAGVVHGTLPCFGGRAPIVRNQGSMSVGDHFATRAQQTRAAFATGVSGRLAMGDRVFVNQGAVIHADIDVQIGSHVLIGDYVAICDTDFHEVDPGLGVRTGGIVIGDNVWLARSVIVLPGASIGAGTVVAAGSVVRGALPPWVVAAGSPARPVRDITTRGTRR